ncbi:CRISPR-associated protein Cmr4 [Thermoanaerobacter thermohydrosulfuricus]|uniref:CRISPR-associated protein Cmr4 n=1 Tax=Thermoanaerobacter thermohydrosulfuricus TaxID=1516 RepID=A0A1I2AAF2_THETY|nr:RAMP superfamily CRISPR-associated protein [Thermoanaerobacter thermohydrosulfuricus]SDF83382.1 CRISPR-associated protein Cmr4 [Thermoanaerobacter thermohydrosulfuricus]SFE40697.1 CRISPR-associated protein Cmr4 [Thermoanaerobacter thermohydrosulfuricus]
MSDNFVKEFGVYGMATDPIYIGTGGYTIGRVDNTIVRDPITKLPKIPGSSLAGTWRYYATLELQSKFKNEFRINKGNRKEKKLEDLFQNSPPPWVLFEGNRYAGIKCAGQDNTPQAEISNAPYATDDKGKTGHCGHCIICKGFGFSKKDLSWQGMIHFSDLNILFFPVFTRFGTKWITTKEALKSTRLYDEKTKTDEKSEKKEVCIALEEMKEGKVDGHINLGWIYLPYKVESLLIKLNEIEIGNFKFTADKIIIVPESLFSQIVNSNLEVRTSVSIDPITGAAKEGALFTSEAIPRGTIFYGDLRIHDKSAFKGLLDKVGDLPDYTMLKEALCDSKHFFETLGIGGMTTRGFGRIVLEIRDEDKNCEKAIPNQLNTGKTDPNGGEQK